MPVHECESAALPRPAARRADGLQRRAASGPLVFALPGQSRFVARTGDAGLERVEVGHFPDGELHVEVPTRAAGRRCVVVGSIARRRATSNGSPCSPTRCAAPGRPASPHCCPTWPTRHRRDAGVVLPRAASRGRRADRRRRDARTVHGPGLARDVRRGRPGLWITDTILSRRRPREAQIVPVAPLLMPALVRRGS